MLHEALLTGLDVAIGLSLREFVGLGEDYTKGYSIYAKEFEEAKIDILWLKARIDKHEEKVHLLALQNVVGDELGELATGGLRHTCVAITWQVHQVPTIVDEEVVKLVKAAYETLMNSVQPVFAKLYQQSAGAQGGPDMGPDMGGADGGEFHQ